MSVPDFSDPQPAYLQIADDLRQEVAAGRLKLGERLPARRQLAQRYGVAVETVRRALDELAHDGLISTQSTRGTYVVKTPDQNEPFSELQQAMTEVRRLAERVEGLESRVKDLEGR
ncbi:GntR family transcriptional regulator [Streptosporangium lutulentum]|uniref:DNA-binding GntR family transcriptional regulator n=1 Tax=Streptosporangium lutulentum TaxID=1461250 RepID=A0ABT9QPG7_9ACTN|nr:DNA-binding GntR family transcriptional regulator [Streptosporangium lutulentum]